MNFVHLLLEKNLYQPFNFTFLDFMYALQTEQCSYITKKKHRNVLHVLKKIEMISAMLLILSTDQTVAPFRLVVIVVPILDITKLVPVQVYQHKRSIAHTHYLSDAEQISFYSNPKFPYLWVLSRCLRLQICQKHCKVQ